MANPIPIPQGATLQPLTQGTPIPAGATLQPLQDSSNADGSQTQAPTQPQATIGAAPTGALPWLRNLESDVRYGSNSTGIGKFLHTIGMQPTANGVAPAAEHIMASPVVGPIHAAQGAAEIPSHPWQGTKDLVGGALETTTIPGMMVMPEATAAGGAKAAAGIISKIPSKARAGQAFQDVMGAAKDFPISTTDELSGALSKYQDLVNSGGSQSLSVRKLLNRITDPQKGPLTYQEARDFYSNISRLSADEMGRLTPVMKRQVGAVRAALGNSIQQTATIAGKGSQYLGAMKEYGQASKLEDFKEMLKGQAVSTLGKAVGGGIAGYGATKVAKKILKK